MTMMIISLSLILVVIFGMMTMADPTPLASNQRSIINDWYKSLNDADKGYLNWNTTEDICTLPSNAQASISCNETTHEITEFDTTPNTLNAWIPASFANLTILFNFGYYQDTIGPFPDEFFAGMSNMMSFVLQGPFNTSLPSTISAMQDLLFFSIYKFL
jgi:hypothetical protein